MSQTSRSLPPVGRSKSADGSSPTSSIAATAAISSSFISTTTSANGMYANGSVTTRSSSIGRSSSISGGVYAHRRRRTVPAAKLDGVVEMDNIRAAAPRHSFGLQHRFAPAKLTYVSAYHNSDLLATTGPGPSKYYTDPSTDPTKPRAAAVSWGGKRAAAVRQLATSARSHKQQIMYNEAAEVGPAAYAPNIGVTRITAPRAKFGTASRFDYRMAEAAPTIYHPQYQKTERAAPSYSIGPPTTSVEDRQALRSERTFFMTHNVAGGLARAATLEDGVGPADYRPHVVLPRQPVYTFGSSGGPDTTAPDRFQKPGTQFLSAEHCRSQAGQHSPGPKYNHPQFDMANAGIAKSPRSHGLKWVP